MALPSKSTLPVWLAVLFLVFLIPACSVTPDKPKDGGKKSAASKAREPDWRPPTHLVKKGDTLYAIALEYGYDYKELAEINGIVPPYIIRIGQTLKLASPPAQESQAAVATPLKPAVSISESRVSLPANDKLKTQPKPVKIPWSAEAENAIKPEPVPVKVVSVPVVQDAKQPEIRPAESKPAPVAADDKKPVQPAPAEDDDLDWAWPSKGKLVASFNESNNSKGIDIAGKSGQAVLAAESGKVVYSGSGLRGYGKLVIIKHNKTFLSAYAHNSQILVKEGQSVTKGQRIAEMGNSDADQIKLHFEIRRLGKPVDPLRYLPDNG
ncbi:MAG: peptidoglycan DD-metalloendopeptidase family protein [Sulfuricellaceae bacterium]|nr:peptidoglycan DD-metalloendopeptidase family protein [Sulfuricellaceae bacterium]